MQAATQTRKGAVAALVGHYMVGCCRQDQLVWMQAEQQLTQGGSLISCAEDNGGVLRRPAPEQDAVCGAAPPDQVFNLPVNHSVPVELRLSRGAVIAIEAAACMHANFKKKRCQRQKLSCLLRSCACFTLPAQHAAESSEAGQQARVPTLQSEHRRHGPHL